MKLIFLLATLLILVAGPVQAQENPLAENLEAKIMAGLLVDPGTGGSANLLVTPKKLDWFVKPAMDFGLGSRLLSVNQTGEDAALHAGLGICLWKAVCGVRVYDFQMKDDLWNFSIDFVNLYNLANGNVP